MHCQKCRVTIKLDESLANLNPASFRILTGTPLAQSSYPSNVTIDAARNVQPQAPPPPRSIAAAQRREQYDQAAKEPEQPQDDQDPGRSASAKKAHAATSQNPAMSFVMLSQSQIGTPTLDESSIRQSSRAGCKNDTTKPDTVTDSLSSQMEKAQRLFEILSARSDIDHPICSECTELVMTGLQQKQVAVNHERDAYAGFLRDAQHNIPSQAEQERVRDALDAAKEQEAKALAELEDLEAQRAAVEEEIAALDCESLDLEKEKETFWRDRNAFEERLAAERDERDSLCHQVAKETVLLEALQRTNVYNDSFCIGHDGHFGTINGLRLGRLPDHSVEWPEINAAWGQVVLLLVVVAEKLGFAFSGYRLLPIGSCSKVERIEYPAPNTPGKPKITQHELFTSGDLPLGLGFLHRGFDNAMVCFLDCLGQLGHHVAHPATGQGVKMPYEIKKDRIGDDKRMASIKLGAFSQEEEWTKACKNTLTCCKFLLAHASRIDDQR